MSAERRQARRSRCSKPAASSPLYRRAPEDLSASGQRQVPQASNGSILAVTLGIYYVTPWLRWDRGPYAPDQAVLVDLANRRFYFFFIEIWPQEFYYVTGLLIMAGARRCSWSPRWSGASGAAMPARRRCGPTSSIAVERLIEGDRTRRIAARRGAVDARQASRKRR